MIYISSYNVSR